MKKYWIAILLSLLILIVAYVAYNFSNISQLFRYILIQNGVIEKQVNRFDVNTLDLSKLKNFTNNGYVFYYPENYELNKKPNSLVFVKDLSQIAEVRVIKLSSSDPVEYERDLGNYFFSTDENLENIQNVEEFMNTYLKTKKEGVISNETKFYISNEFQNDNSSLSFKKYYVSNYTILDELQFMVFNEEQNPLNQVVFYANKDILAIAFLSVSYIEESAYFINLLNLVTTNPVTIPQ